MNRSDTPRWDDNLYIDRETEQVLGHVSPFEIKVYPVGTEEARPRTLWSAACNGQTIGQFTARARAMAAVEHAATLFAQMNSGQPRRPLVVS